MTTPDPADVHTGTDRVERDEFIQAVLNVEKDYLAGKHPGGSVVSAVVDEVVMPLAAELAAANTRCAELEAQKVADHETWLQEVEERDAMLIERDATLDRVTAVISTPDGHREWHNQGRSGVCQVVDVSRLRAALTPEGKP